MEHITIRDIKVFVTAPRNINLVVVKVETSEPELYGYGCATFTWRHKAVVTAIEEYLAPMLKGRPVEDIEGLWHHDGQLLLEKRSGTEQCHFRCG